MRKSAAAFAKQKKYQQEYNRRPEVKKRRNKYLRAWCKRNPEMRFMRYFRHRLKKRYGMTPEQFYELANAFDGKCFICQREMIIPNKVTRPVRHGRCAVVDHDHKINEVRGVICNNCNRAIGFLSDSGMLHRAKVYIDCFNKVYYGTS
jgi:hypothetical protein